MSSLMFDLFVFILMNRITAGANAAVTYDSTCTCEQISTKACMTYTCVSIPQEPKCFPGSSQIALDDGSFKALSDIMIGDRVLVNKHNIHEPIIGFIHAKRNSLFDFLAIEIQSVAFNSSSTLMVSPNHLIFDFDSNNVRFAGYFRIGERVQVIHNNQIIPGEIISIQLTKQQGYYAPLTESGTIVVNGVLASNYATVSNHVLAHRIMSIYRWLIKLVVTSTSSEQISWILEVMWQMQQMIVWCGGDKLTGIHTYDGTFEVSGFV
ncbi:unnamed protein product [Rotaria magnacalcarata]